MRHNLPPGHVVRPDRKTKQKISLNNGKLVTRQVPVLSKSKTDPFTPFVELQPDETTMPDAAKEMLSAMGGNIFGEGRRKIFTNSLYFVIVETIPGPDGVVSDSISLSIRNTARTNVFPWRDLQRIKNELAGPEREAIEIFPAESRLVDTSDQRYLFVLPAGTYVPYGFSERLLIEEIAGTGSQTPFGQFNRPTDIKTVAEALEGHKQGSTPESTN